MSTQYSVTTITCENFSDIPLLTRLLELHTIPKKIHIQGTFPSVTFDEYGRATPRILTVIGSRKCTTYGRHALEKLIESLRGYNVVILSGLAYGIDSLAHQSAINNNLITISIPGSGLDDRVLYPSAHRQLKNRILDSGGAMFSELETMSKAAPWTFPQRNRIMAALSDAILVIEAEEKSGTLVTARQALELGRDIGAIPGEIFSKTSSGTNMLIHEGAYPITSTDDLLELLHLKKLNTGVNTDTRRTMTVHEKIILELLTEPQDKDTLFQKSNLSFVDFVSAFSSLEIDKVIEESLGEVRALV